MLALHSAIFRAIFGKHLTDKHPSQAARLLSSSKESCKHHKLAGMQDEYALEECCEGQLALCTLLLQLSWSEAFLLMMHLQGSCHLTLEYILIADAV